MRSVPLQNSLQVQNSPGTCQTKQSLPLASKWLPIPTTVRTQQVLSEMEAAEPWGFPLPLCCVFRHCSSAEEQQLILCQSKKRCSSGSRLAQRTEPPLGQAYTSTKTATRGFGCGNIHSFCSWTFANQSSATNHTVLRVPIVRRCPDNRARQVNISDSTVIFSQASDKPGRALPTTALASQGASKTHVAHREHFHPMRQGISKMRSTEKGQGKTPFISS